jgi:GNAT superfamily N-acetyltransferase
LANEPLEPWAIERLDKGHERRSFDCGNMLLNEWLQARAGQFERRDLARTYVAVVPGNNSVLGYYALSAHRITYEALPEEQRKGLPNLDLPVVLLGKLAVDVSRRGKGLGAFLLMDALARSQPLADHIGIRAVEVDAIDEAARAFYLRFGFTALRDDPRHLLLPMQSIRRLGLLG